MGHSLENDLTALKIVHTRVVDTSVLYPSSKGRGFKNALRWLVKKYPLFFLFLPNLTFIIITINIIIPILLISMYIFAEGHTDGDT